MSEPAQKTSTDLATRDRMAPELDRIGRLGMWLAALEGKDPRDPRAGAAAAYRVWLAEQLGIGPHAASQIEVIDNKAAIRSELLRALALRDGYTVKAEESTRETCTAVLYRDGEELGRSTFTIEDAKQAGLTGKTNWRMYPQRMLWARASGYVIRDFAPGVGLGFMTTEELGAEDPPAPRPSDLRVVDEDLQKADYAADAEDAEFSEIPPSPLDEETQVALDELGAEEVPSPFVAPTTKKSGS